MNGMVSYEYNMDWFILTWQAMHLCTQMLKTGAISLPGKLLFCLLRLCPKPLIDRRLLLRLRTVPALTFIMQNPF